MFLPGLWDEYYCTYHADCGKSGPVVSSHRMQASNNLLGIELRIHVESVAC